MDGIIQKYTSLYIFELRVFQWKNSLLLKSTDILSATSLTFRQTRYQALYKDVQRLIEDTASIAVRKDFILNFLDNSLLQHLFYQTQ